MARHLAHPETWTLVGWFAAILGLSIFVSFYLSWTAVLLLGAIGAIFVACLFRPAWGVYLLAFAAPMSGLAINFARDPSLARIPYLGAIQAPLVDFIAILLLVVAGTLALFQSRRVQWHAITTHMGFFAWWLLAAALSVYYADPVYQGTAAKAWVRPYVFAYLGFVVPILLLMRQRIELVRALLAYEYAALLGAFMGLVSVFIMPAVGFIRAQPFTMFGYQPFGVNHNVLAESLTAIIPFAWWYAARRATEYRALAFGAAGLLTAVSLLTFSRAAWIVVGLQAFAWIAWKHGTGAATQRLSPWLRGRVVGGLVIAALALFFVWITNTQIAESSNATRLDLTGIAMTYFSRAPWLGQGPGTFVPLVDETALFHMEYGEAQDAHGIVQKVLAETGLVGAVAFGALVFALVIKLWRRRRDELHLVLLVTILSVWAYQLFNTGYFAGKVWVLMGLALSALLL